jgi:hypothetical protein
VLGPSQLSSVKEGLTVDTPWASIDRDAPVLAHHEIGISAPVSLVWTLHQDVNAWPTWQSDITAAQLAKSHCRRSCCGPHRSRLIVSETNS